MDKATQPYFPIIDLCKLACALLVVLIHCLEVREGNPVAVAIVDILSGQAVPFFMIVSGFFVGLKLSEDNTAMQITMKCVKNWLALYFAWAVLWLPYWIHLYSTMYPDVSVIYMLAVLVRRIFFAGQGVYWYVLVLAEAVLLLGLAVRYHKVPMFYIVGGIGLLLGFAYDLDIMAFGLDKINKLMYTVFSWSNNVITKGIPYVALGYYMSRRSEGWKYGLKLWQSATIYGILILGMGILYLRYPKAMYLFYPLQALLLFCFATTGTVNISKTLSHTCRTLSAMLYYVHTIIIYAVIDTTIGVNAPMIIRFGISVLGCVLVYWLAIKIKWKPLQWLLGIK